MSDIAIRVEGLGKQYRLGRRRDRYVTLRDQIRNWTSPRAWFRGSAAQSASTEFWALKDISFEVKRGDVVGIIGRNGAGKSTLLKILSRITKPTEGEADIHGRVGSLLEVGTGFHPELTGRENIFLNGAILGMKRADIVRKFDEIVAFAEVEPFLDTAVKHYSSGMYMRLAFAVAAHLEPEILVVDEVLAVGDAEFQKKCLGKMGDVARGGRTVLFVSHNMAAVRNLCRIAVLLERGQVRQLGPAAEVVAAYMNNGQGADGQLSTSGRRFTPTNAKITDAWLEKDGTRIDSLLFGDRADVVVQIEITEQVRLAVELILRQQDGMPVAFAPSGLANGWHPDVAPGHITVRCQLPRAQLAAGSYSLDLITAISGTEFLDYLESGLTFMVNSSALGERNWSFDQRGGQGCVLWQVAFELDRQVALEERK